MAMNVRCSACGRYGLPRAPGLDGAPAAHVREVRSGGDEKSEFRPCSNKPDYYRMFDGSRVVESDLEET